MRQNATIGIITPETIKLIKITEIVSIGHAIESIKTAIVLSNEIVIREETMLAIKIAS